MRLPRGLDISARDQSQVRRGHRVGARARSRKTVPEGRDRTHASRMPSSVSGWVASAATSARRSASRCVDGPLERRRVDAFAAMFGVHRRRLRSEPEGHAVAFATSSYGRRRSSQGSYSWMTCVADGATSERAWDMSTLQSRHRGRGRTLRGGDRLRHRDPFWARRSGSIKTTRRSASGVTSEACRRGDLQGLLKEGKRLLVRRAEVDAFHQAARDRLRIERRRYRRCVFLRLRRASSRGGPDDVPSARRKGAEYPNKKRKRYARIRLRQASQDVGALLTCTTEG